jgi:hypothetical protein
MAWDEVAPMAADGSYPFPLPLFLWEGDFLECTSFICSIPLLVCMYADQSAGERAPQYGAHVRRKMMAH